MAKVKFTGNASDFLKLGVATAARGDIETVREILKAKPEWIKRVGSHGRTMLWEACHRGKLEMVKYLVRRRANIDQCGTHYTPYFVEVSCYCIARHKKHDDVAEFLLAKGASVDIHTAAFLGDIKLVRSLLKKKKKLIHQGHPQYVMGKKRDDGLDFYLDEAPWATPLCYALRGGDVETVEFLISHGARIAGNEKCLFIAADDQYDMVRLLLENGADVKKGPEVMPGDELFDLVIANGGSRVSAETHNEEFVYMCRGDRGGNPEDVKKMLAQGADVNYQDAKGKTALHRTAKAGFIKTMKVLLKHGAELDLEDTNGETALFDAVRSTIKNSDNKKKAIRLLLKSGANKHHENRKSKTPIDLATSGRTSSDEVAKILKRSGAGR